MRNALLLTLGIAFTLSASNLKLYMKDGSYQIVREYQLDGDRIRYYSVERSDWEEIPAELADIKRTTTESAAREAVVSKKSQQIEEEAEAHREELREIRRIPRDPGVYRIEDGQLVVFKLADAAVHNDKGRLLLKSINPIPNVAAKSTLEIQGEHSINIVADTRPEFFLQQSLEDNVGIIKVTPQKGVRIVERLTVEPVVNTVTEERQSVEVFTKQLTESGLYKIWPQEALAKGEYAVVEYNEGKVDMRVWDFQIR